MTDSSENLILVNMNTDCIFCKIVAKELPSHVVFEDKEHLAFLSIFPNTKGVTVVIPKAHHDSYFAAVPESVSTALLNVVRMVAHKIDTAFPDVGRTGLVFEGFGVNHLHAKLFPLHGTSGKEWQQRTSSIEKYFDHYEGYLSSHDGLRADDIELAETARQIYSQ